MKKNSFIDGKNLESHCHPLIFYKATAPAAKKQKSPGDISIVGESAFHDEDLYSYVR